MLPPLPAKCMCLCVSMDLLGLKFDHPREICNLMIIDGEFKCNQPNTKYTKIQIIAQ